MLKSLQCEDKPVRSFCQRPDNHGHIAGQDLNAAVEYSAPNKQARTIYKGLDTGLAGRRGHHAFQCLNGSIVLIDLDILPGSAISYQFLSEPADSEGLLKA